jgi:hypothetical protein
MDADYSVELGPDAPALELPWDDPERRFAYVDLRSKPDAIERVPEARQFPALRKLLVAVNSLQSAWQTAKCDVWTESVDAAENLYGAGFAQSCYVDLVLTEHRKLQRGSLELHEKLARQIARSLESDETLEASAEIVVRRCYFHDDDKAIDASDAGYCLTLYISGFGSSADEAASRWESAMGSASECVAGLQPEEERAKGRELS